MTKNSDPQIIHARHEANSNQLGLFAGFTCFFLWGMLPIYFRIMDHIGPLEMLVHRIIWSLPTGILFVLFAHGLGNILAAMTFRRMAWLCLSSIIIASNWLIYIWAINNEKVMEASMGYYINPLLSVLLGRVFFGEPLAFRQAIALILAGFGVIMMAVAIGTLPFTALTLCATFTGYSIIRKQVAVDSRAGFVIESGLLFLPALAWLHLQITQGQLLYFGDGSIHDVFWLIMAGPITAIPLILFSLAARRLHLSTIGMMQYIGPSLQFIIAIIVFHEPFGAYRAIAFGFIWLAVLIYSSPNFTFGRKIWGKPPISGQNNQNVK